MPRVIPILLLMLLTIAAGLAAACGGASHETTVARDVITVAAVQEASPASDADMGDADTACHLSSVCAAIDRSGSLPALGSERVERSSRPAGSRGGSRPAAPPLPPPRTTFRI